MRVAIDRFDEEARRLLVVRDVAVPGYPPEDLLPSDRFVQANPDGCATSPRQLRSGAREPGLGDLMDHLASLEIADLTPTTTASSPELAQLALEDCAFANVPAEVHGARQFRPRLLGPT